MLPALRRMAGIAALAIAVGCSDGAEPPDDDDVTAAQCGPAPAPPCWPSDHGGVQLDLGCAAP